MEYQLEWIVITAKWLLGIEVTITIIFVFVVYSIKIYNIFTSTDKIKLVDTLKTILIERLNSDEKLKKSDIKLLLKEPLITIEIAKQFDADRKLSKKWPALKNEIIQKVILPKMHKLYKSGKLYKRYYAVNLFAYYYQSDDAHMVIKLIHDPVLMISIDAARLGFRNASPELINISINVFSKYRRLQQSVFSTIAADCHSEVESILFQRIVTEKNAYIKAFCYKLLLQFPSSQNFSEETGKDLNDDTLELRLAALNYVAHNPSMKKILCDFLEDNQWQMRAMAAKLLGVVNEESCIECLQKALRDSEWWVRVRAAESLSLLGPAGIQILKEQSPDIDKYAYEAAMQILLSKTQKVSV